MLINKIFEISDSEFQIPIQNIDMTEWFNFVLILIFYLTVIVFFCEILKKMLINKIFEISDSKFQIPIQNIDMT